jgi:hypothetical protein
MCESEVVLVLNLEDIGSGCVAIIWSGHFQPLPLCPQRKNPRTCSMGDRMGPRIVLDKVERRNILSLLGLEL